MINILISLVQHHHFIYIISRQVLLTAYVQVRFVLLSCIWCVCVVLLFIMFCWYLTEIRLALVVQINYLSRTFELLFDCYFIIMSIWMIILECISIKSLYLCVITLVTHNILYCSLILLLCLRRMLENNLRVFKTNSWDILRYNFVLM